jgi:uncharacterized protein
MMRRLLSFFLCVCVYQAVLGQVVTDTVPEGFRQFFYPGGQVSSEGILVNGQPDGFWRSYHENGVLKSEGNRVNFELDGPWKFYDTEGSVRLVIHYKEGVKHGLRITYRDDGRIEENFEEDEKEGFTLRYDEEGYLVRRTPFEKGREQGLSFTYNRDSVVTEIMEYRRGVAISREFVNRYDHEGKPHGLWKTFYPGGIIKEEFTYRHGLLHGYYRKYNRMGNLETITKYVNGIEERDSDEIYELEIRRNYYPDMTIRTQTTFREGTEHGIRREYHQDGSLKVAYIIDMGRIMGMGVLDGFGKKQGIWKEFYPQGGLRSEGSYRDGIRTGKWTFYYVNGEVEQTGNYNNQGKEHGEWIWYYQGGQTRREESYLSGKRDGMMSEYGIEGDIIAKGEFVDDEEEGAWYFQEQGYRREGTYAEGELDGEWIHYFPDGSISFTGEFIDGYPDGRHVHYNYNGTIRSEGRFIMGTRHGEWRFHDQDGNLMIVIEYRNGIEIRYDYRLIRPEIKESDL